MKNDAVDAIKQFKGESLKTVLADIVAGMQAKEGKDNLSNKPELWQAALEVKKASAQIHEVVHALGILQAWEIIREEGEEFQDACLAASGRGKQRFDLVTNKRIAEFKFAGWQAGKANGVRNRNALKDLVGLIMANTNKRKEFYVASESAVAHFFQSGRAWDKILDKSGKNIRTEFAEWLKTNNLSEIKTVKEVFELSQKKGSTAFVELIDVEEIFRQQGINYI